MRKEEREEKGLDIGVKSFVTATVVIFVLMVFTYALTFVIPGGEIPFWKWALSPILVLGAKDNVSLIAVILFLLVIGGVFNCLDKCGLMKYMLDKLTNRFSKKRYQLLALVSLFFMGMGAFIGSFEECVPLVPIIVALAIRLGWDAQVGIGMSLLAIGCGFASGVCNPFTVGVAQQLAGLAMFSGIWFRMIAFLLIYVLLVGFLMHYAKKIENPVCDLVESNFARNTKKETALRVFVGLMSIGMMLVISSVWVPVLQTYSMIIVALTFLLAGTISSILTGTVGNFKRTFLKGILNVVPGILMILMANSIKYTLVEAGILDTILQSAIGFAETLPKWTVILFLYLLVLVLNFFIASGSAKAFLLMPLIVPVAEAFGISSQLCVMAYAFGDGFSNVLYPTNPVLLISLGLANVNYGKWFKWSIRFQLLNLILTSGLLLLGLGIGY